jgi:hypothetical protein
MPKFRDVDRYVLEGTVAGQAYAVHLRHLLTSVVSNFAAPRRVRP